MSRNSPARRDADLVESLSNLGSINGWSSSSIEGVNWPCNGSMPLCFLDGLLQTEEDELPGVLETGHVESVESVLRAGELSGLQGFRSWCLTLKIEA